MTWIDADVADMWMCEANELSLVAGVGHDLLISSHGGIEHDFADMRPLSTKSNATPNAPVLEHETRCLGRPRCRGDADGGGATQGATESTSG